MRLPQLVSDGMVLQRDQKINIWGWASPGEKLKVNFKGKTYKATTGADGKWMLQMPAIEAGGPYSMTINASNHVQLKDILVGDVWFCAGQSNMVTPMERVKERYPDEIANANYPQIRNFFVPTASDVIKEHNDLPPGKWMPATPVNVMNFGAVSYFMAKQLHLKYHVPIGIINSSVGGTPIQAWISKDGYRELPAYTNRLKQFSDSAFVNKINRPVQPRPAASAPFVQQDKGLAEPVKWFDNAYVPDGWHKFWLPGYWADQGVRGLNGVIWFRKEVDVPASMAGKAAKLFAGRIIDADETYVNGVKVGNITYQYPPRRYEVPAGLLKAGKNTIVVRITNTFGKGGFVPDKRYELTDGATTIDLRGDWLYKVGQVFKPLRRSMGDIESGFAFSAQNEPTGLYNTMVKPAVDYGVKGFVWYQGESNAGNAKEYNSLLRALISDWRTQWHNAALPFIVIQLPNYGDTEYSPVESQWAELRDGQLKVLDIPKTALAVTIDLGEWNDIHPLNKKDVGDRVALAAEKLAYGNTKLVSSGPLYQSASIAGNKIIVSFTNTGSGLMAKGGKLARFAIAGADKQFVWADAQIEGDKVSVSSPEVAEPKYVRYAWADNPEGANLYNKEGLPASPFRTDK
ncbi:sialate O-acetylesterase [Mucilaginibacter sp. CSA2-8R]|uniref:sialate O-acetylesterase n=1 Tax=Mucilaginibacter sp. CSA2-8R TaxID=3141542 RepID=UPI00315C7500